MKAVELRVRETVWSTKKGEGYNIAAPASKGEGLGGLERRILKMQSEDNDKKMMYGCKLFGGKKGAKGFYFYFKYIRSICS